MNPSALVAVLGALGASDPAVDPDLKPPAPERLAVLWLMGEPSPFTLSEGLRIVARQVEGHTRLRVLPPEATPVDPASLQACRGDGRCYADRIRRAVPAEYGLVLITTPLEGQVVVGIRVLDLARATELGRFGDAVDASDLAAAIPSGLAWAFPPRLYGRSDLRVDVEGTDFSLQVDGQVCKSPCVRPDLSPGRHEAVALRGDQVLERRVVDLRPNEQAHIRLTAPAPKARKSAWSSPWLWTGIGAGVALAITTTILLTDSNAQTTCIRTASQSCP